MANTFKFKVSYHFNYSLTHHHTFFFVVNNTPGYQYWKCFCFNSRISCTFWNWFGFRYYLFLAFAGRKHLKLDCSNRRIGNEHSVWMIENAITNHWQFVVLISRETEGESEREWGGGSFKKAGNSSIMFTSRECDPADNATKLYHVLKVMTDHRRCKVSEG